MKLIKLPLFDFHYDIIVEETTDLARKVMQETYPGCETSIGTGCVAETFHINGPNMYAFFGMVFTKDATMEQVVHESLHLTHMMLDYMKISRGAGQSDEIECYIQGEIISKALPLISHYDSKRFKKSLRPEIAGCTKEVEPTEEDVLEVLTLNDAPKGIYACANAEEFAEEVEKLGMELLLSKFQYKFTEETFYIFMTEVWDLRLIENEDCNDLIEALLNSMKSKNYIIKDSNTGFYYKADQIAAKP
jgi:hypothetical protein